MYMAGEFEISHTRICSGLRKWGLQKAKAGGPASPSTYCLYTHNLGNAFAQADLWICGLAFIS